jgi:antitoxin HigA-1
MLRRPTHPGEMLREGFLSDYGLTVSGLAEAVGVSRQSIDELLRGRRAISPKMALRFSRLFGNSPEFWLNAQRAVDLWDAAQAIKTEVERIKPLTVAWQRRPADSAPRRSWRRIEIPARTLGEPRFAVIGLIADGHWSAVITYRGEAVRLISVRRSRKGEAALYEG